MCILQPDNEPVEEEKEEEEEERKQEAAALTLQSVEEKEGLYTVYSARHVCTSLSIDMCAVAFTQFDMIVVAYRLVLRTYVMQEDAFCYFL